MVNGHVDDTGLGQGAHIGVGVAVAQPDDVAGSRTSPLLPRMAGGVGVAVPGDLMREPVAARCAAVAGDDAAHLP